VHHFVFSSNWKVLLLSEDDFAKVISHSPLASELVWLEEYQFGDCFSCRSEFEAKRQWEAWEASAKVAAKVAAWFTLVLKEVCEHTDLP